ncbi:MAG: NfeD family protein [Aquihabitans sp.]
MRRLPIIGLLLALVAALLLAATPSGASPRAVQQDDAEAQQDDTDHGRVSVIKVEGLIDPVMANFIEQSVEAGEEAGVVAVVLQINSDGAVISDGRMEQLARTMSESSVTVAAWVGPSGSSALGGAAQIVGAADYIGVSPGSQLGKTGDLVVPEDLLKPEFVAAKDRLRNGTIDDEQSRSLEIGPVQPADVIGSFLIDIPGFDSEQTTVDGKLETKPLTVPVFSALPIQDQLFHTVASPPAAYLLLLIGLSLIIFELYTAGVGVAGLVGAGAFVLSCYGLSILPVRPVAIVLVLVAMFGFTVDVQTGAPRVWSAIGVVALVAGSLLFYDGVSLSWISLLVGIVGVPLSMILGMPTMVRTRFSTPIIDREWMIGDEGETTSALDPEGVVRVRGGLWPARGAAGASFTSDAPVRVVDVDGLLLEVEPANEASASQV